MFKINCKQSVKLRSGLIKSDNRSKQFAVPFKIYDDFESVLRGVQRANQEQISYSFAYKVVCIDDKFSKPVVLYRGMFITAILNDMNIVDWL